MQLYGAEPTVIKEDERATYTVRPTDAEINEMYNKAGLFIQTSYHEGFSLPILEAMAAGCAVICTDAHGNRGFCFDGKNCIMVKTDNVEETAAAINMLQKDLKLQKQLSTAALKTVQDFTWETIANKLDAYFTKLESQKNRAYIKSVVKKY